MFLMKHGVDLIALTDDIWEVMLETYELLMMDSTCFNVALREIEVINEKLPCNHILLLLLLWES